MMQKKLRSTTLLFISIPIVISLTGCVSPYMYKSMSDTDPSIMFGDQSQINQYDVVDDANHVIQHKNFAAFRNFKISVADGKECKNFRSVDTIFGHDSVNNGSYPNTITIKVPSQKQVAIKASIATKPWLHHTLSCTPKDVLFTPESNSKYSVDVVSSAVWHGSVLPSARFTSCQIRIQKVLDDGARQDVQEAVAIPSCQK